MLRRRQRQAASEIGGQVGLRLSPAKAAEAAQKRQEEFDKLAVGRAARAQIQAMQKQSETANKGEPARKWQMG